MKAEQVMVGKVATAIVESDGFKNAIAKAVAQAIGQQKQNAKTICATEEQEEKWVMHNGFKVKADAVPNTGKYAQAKERIERAYTQAKQKPATQAKSKADGKLPVWMKGIVEFWKASKHAKFISAECYDAEAGIWNVKYKVGKTEHVKGYRVNSKGMVYCVFRQ